MNTDMASYDKKVEYTLDDIGYNPTTQRGVFRIPIVKREKKDHYIRNGNHYEPVIYRSEYVSYTKVFALPKSHKDRVYKLSPRGKELYTFFMYEVKPGDEHIWLNRSRYMSIMGIKSITTILDVIKELVKANIIAKTVVKDVFWINPVFFYNGDRLKKYPDNIDDSISYDYTEDAEEEIGMQRMVERSKQQTNE